MIASQNNFILQFLTIFKMKQFDSEYSHIVICKVDKNLKLLF